MRVYRSPLKLFVFGVVGIILMIGAADVMFGYWLSIPPDSLNGVLTTRGLAQQRGDLLLGGVMLVIGIILFVGSVVQLVRRKPLTEVSAEGFALDTGEHDAALIPWGGIESISSVVESDAFDGSLRELLLIDLVPGYMPPESSSHLEIQNSTVRIDAHDWSTPVTEVALAGQGALDHFRRVKAAREYEPPSVVWMDPSDGTAANDEEESPLSEESKPDDASGTDDESETTLVDEDSTEDTPSEEEES